MSRFNLLMMVGLLVACQQEIPQMPAVKSCPTDVSIAGVSNNNSNTLIFIQGAVTQLDVLYKEGKISEAVYKDGINYFSNQLSLFLPGIANESCRLEIIRNLDLKEFLTDGLLGRIDHWAWYWQLLSVLMLMVIGGLVGYYIYYRILMKALLGAFK